MLDQPENPPAELTPKAPLGKRVLAWTVVLGIYAVILGMAGYAVVLIRHSFNSGTSLDTRISLWLVAAALLVLPVSLARVYLRNKWTTGRWVTPKQAKRQTLAVQTASQFVARRNPMTQIPPWSWFIFAAQWGDNAAREQDTPLWRRALGWTLVLLFVALMLLLTAAAVIFIGAGFATLHSLGLTMIGLGLLLLLVPGQFVWACIRRKRETGSLRISREELQQSRTQRADWQARENQRPLGTKITSTVALVVILSASWIREAMRHAQHLRSNRFNPALWTVVAAYIIWIQFRKPKTSPPQTPDTSAGA